MVHFTEYNTRVAAYALIVDEAGRVLLTWFVGSDNAVPCWTMPGGGVEYEESLPEAVQRYTTFASGIVAGAKESEAAKALVKFITAPAAAQAYKKRGMEPG